MKSVEENCLALQALGHSMRSLLGPTTSVKCYIEESWSGDHSAGLVLEPLQILNALTSVQSHGHPTNQLLYECCQGQQRECGCGVTTLVCMCGLWAGGVVKLTQQDVPLPAILSLMEQGLQVLTSLFTSHAVSIATMSHDKSSAAHQMLKLKTFSRHFSPTNRDIPSLLSSGLAHGRQEAMKLAVQALKLRGDDGVVLSHTVIGPVQSSSHVLQGVVVNVQSDMTTHIPVSTTSQLQVVVLEGDCTLTSTHPGFSVTRSHDLLFKKRTESDWLKQCASTITKFNIGLIVVGGVMSSSLWEQCLATGVLVLTNVERRRREAIVSLSGCVNSFQYLTHLSQAHIGSVSVKLVQGGWTVPTFSKDGTKRPIKTYACCIHGNGASVVTAMLCGSAECTVDLLSQQFYNCLHRLDNVLCDGCALPGGGVFERQCAAKLRESVCDAPSSAVRGWMCDPGVMRGWRLCVWGVLADGLETYADIVGGCDECGVWDDRVSKESAWSLALSLIRTVSNIDTIR